MEIYIVQHHVHTYTLQPQFHIGVVVILVSRGIPIVVASAIASSTTGKTKHADKASSTITLT